MLLEKKLKRFSNREFTIKFTKIKNLTKKDREELMKLLDDEVIWDLVISRIEVEESFLEEYMVEMTKSNQNNFSAKYVAMYQNISFKFIKRNQEKFEGCWSFILQNQTHLTREQVMSIEGIPPQYIIGDGK
jgi:DNA mismatch repair ATPase MutS